MKHYRWRSLTFDERFEAIKKIETIEENSREQIRAKAILTYFVKDNMNASSISRLNDNRIVSFCHKTYLKPLTASSILEVVYQYFPEWRGKQMQQGVSKKNRVDLIKKRRFFASPHIMQCAFCGSKNNLEEHHMIPLFMGGTNDDENLIFLCEKCHKGVSNYQYQLRKERDHE